MNPHPANRQDSSIRIRPATQADLPHILKIEHESFVHAGERFGPRTLRCLVRNRRAVALVAEANGQIAGWAAGFGRYNSPQPWGRVYALAIHPDSRGRKLGQALLRDIIIALRDRGAGDIYLEVRPDNHAAVKLYEKAGFTTCRLLPHYYGPDLSGQRMRLISPHPSL